MSYGRFSSIYDRLIAEDVDYGRLCDFIENVFTLRGTAPQLVADLACGTGGVTLPLARRGYDMIGIDRSADMLNIARSKSGGHGILFLNQDITALDLYGTVGGAVCMTDGFNYILSDKALFNALVRLRTCFLDPGAALIFDVSSEYKLKHQLGDNTFVYDSGDIFYAWENRYFEKKQLCDMTINFLHKKNGRWQRICERQLQRARTAERLCSILRAAGYVNIEYFSSTEFAPADASAPRLLFAAQNPF